VRKIAAQADVNPHRLHSISMPAGGGGPPDVSSRRFLPRPRERRFFFGPSSGRQQCDALVVTRIGKTIPPRREVRALAFELTALAAQVEKVPSGTITRVLEQSERPLPGALLETAAATTRFP
jgi:hypothetical protein